MTNIHNNLNIDCTCKQCKPIHEKCEHSTTNKSGICNQCLIPIFSKKCECYPCEHGFKCVGKMIDDQVCPTPSVEGIMEEFDRRFVIKNDGWRVTGMTSDTILNGSITPASIKSFILSYGKSEYLKGVTEGAINQVHFDARGIAETENTKGYKQGMKDGFEQGRQLVKNELGYILDKELCEWMRKEGYSAKYAEMKKRDILSTLIK